MIGEGDELYHLNPDLVFDRNDIILCSKCACDPRSHPFSIASGHDYGRAGALPKLNEMELNCIAPVRRFGLELTLSGQHVTGHVICFPADGPVQCSRMLPNTDNSCRVTFVGSKEQWRIKKRCFRKVYRVDAGAICEWLRVLAGAHIFCQ